MQSIVYWGTVQKQQLKQQQQIAIPDSVLCREFKPDHTHRFYILVALQITKKTDKCVWKWFKTGFDRQQNHNRRQQQQQWWRWRQRCWRRWRRVSFSSTILALHRIHFFSTLSKSIEATFFQAPIELSSDFEKELRRAAVALDNFLFSPSIEKTCLFGRGFVRNWLIKNWMHLCKDDKNTTHTQHEHKQTMTKKMRRRLHYSTFSWTYCNSFIIQSTCFNNSNGPKSNRQTRTRSNIDNIAHNHNHLNILLPCSIEIWNEEENKNEEEKEST